MQAAFLELEALRPARTIRPAKSSRREHPRASNGRFSTLKTRASACHLISVFAAGRRVRVDLCVFGGDSFLTAQILSVRRSAIERLGRFPTLYDWQANCQRVAELVRLVIH